MVDGYMYDGSHMPRRSPRLNPTQISSERRMQSITSNVPNSSRRIERQGTARRARQRWNRRQHRVAHNNPEPVNLDTTSQKEPHIPGYYYDATTKKFFKIAGETSGLAGHTLADKKRVDLENKRLSLFGANRDPLRSNLFGYTPLTHLMSDLSLGRISSNTFSLKVTEGGIANINKNPSVIYENPLTAYYSLKGCQFMEASADGTNLFSCWATQYYAMNKERLANIGIQVHVDDDLADKNKREAERRTDQENEEAPLNTLGLVFESSTHWAEMGDPSLVDICIAPVDKDVTCCLYATARTRMSVHGLRTRCSVFLQPISELCSPDSIDILNSPIYNSLWSMDQSVYSCAWSGNKMRISLGLNDSAKIMDVVSEQHFLISSKKRNVLSQQFSPDGNLIYMGLRSENVIQSDLRMPSRHVTGTLKGTRNASYLRVLQSAHPNGIITDTFSGQLKLWDLRRPDRAIMKFEGHKNTHYRLPAYVDRQERFLFAVGEDEHTRGWSLSSGNLLCMIPSARPVEKRSDFPRVVYNDTWGGRAGNAGLIIAVGDSCRVHPLHH